ncbi:MAG TPA: 3-hydroxyacyl-ACP dehydratase FabZ family protein [Lacipirellulaceae bacterium]|nr:3-hydroxyacyl-ACP dehydratase FabZ family protein [Lacipirellulaceae bacterium]HMP06640.1 3-hydroxyacyl-ACP dehydratase FabZ family protein [Lacipirellulaceae bacterium]
MRWFWIDRFTEFVSGSHAVAVKGLSLAEDYLHEHFAGYPVMPNSLVIEGVAQAGGLLVSEHYGFSELVVLAKVSKARFTGRLRPGRLLEYRVKADWIRTDSAQVSGTVYDGERVQGEVQLMYARMGEDMAQKLGKRLFSPAHLRHWLSLVGVFEVGVKADGTPLRAADYPLDEAAPAGAGV